MVLSIGCGCSLSQREAKSCPLVHDTFSPDLPAMPFDDTLDGCQPDSCSAKLALIVQPLEGRKQLSRPRHVESRAIITHEISSRAIGLRQGAKLDSRSGSFGGKFPGIAKQVFKHHAQQPHVTLNRETIRDYPLNRPVGVILFELG